MTSNENTSTCRIVWLAGSGDSLDMDRTYAGKRSKGRECTRGVVSCKTVEAANVFS